MHVTLQSLRARIDRALLMVQKQAAEGFAQSHTVADGTTHDYAVVGIKPPEQLEDELLALFIWVWSLKDHIKLAFERKGLVGRTVEEIVNNSIALQYVADIANRAKHGELRNSRSGQFAELVDVEINIPQDALSSISVGAFDVRVKVAKPEQAALSASVQLRSGAVLDAFVVLSEAMAKWEEHALVKLTA